MVESLPTLSCLLRDAALGGRYGALPARQRARLLNAEVRCISRVVVDPRWRGLGLAVALVRHALATAETTYTEALAAMGAVSPFFERAGMAPYHRPPHAHDARLIAALNTLGDPAALLADVAGLDRRIDALPVTTRAWIERELKRWHGCALGRGGRKGVDRPTVLCDARDRLLNCPVYYLHDNRGGTRRRCGNG